MRDAEKTSDVASTETPTTSSELKTVQLAEQEASGQQRNPKTPKKNGPRRMTLCDAMRARGFDEHAIADGYVSMVKKLSQNGCAAADKLLVDVLKEVTRLLDPRRAEARRGEYASRFVGIQMIHKVPRPVRGESSPKAKS